MKIGVAPAYGASYKEPDKRCWVDSLAVVDSLTTDTSIGDYMDVTFNKAVVIEVIGRLKGRANSWGNRGNQSRNEIKSKLSKEIEFELNDFAKMLIQASNNPEYVGSTKAYWDSVGRT